MEIWGGIGRCHVQTPLGARPDLGTQTRYEAPGHDKLSD